MIFIDPLQRTLPCQETGWGYKNYCHLFAESVDELHRFAVDTLGLKREYFQDLKGFPHYDLTKTKRGLALRNGAVEISSRDLVERADAIFGEADSWLKNVKSRNSSNRQE
jgi:hypothetical protein